MTWFILSLFTVSPILGFLISLIGYFFDNNGKRYILYSLIIALFIGIIAYNFIPLSSYDLVRHHYEVKSFAFHGISYMDISTLELIPKLICYLFSFFNNVNLLQFFVSALGYFIIFYILADYRKLKQIDIYSFALVTIFTFFSFNMLNFISGLWNYMAIIIFALALYKDYIKEENKIICYVLYFLTLLIHNSMIFPFGMLVFYKILKNKINLLTIVLVTVLLITSMFSLHAFNLIFDISFFKEIEYQLSVYLNKNSIMYAFYGGKVLIMELLKLFLIICLLFCQKQRDKLKGINGYIILLSCVMLAILFESIVFIRFVMLVGFIGIIPLMDFFKDATSKQRLVFTILFLIITILFVIYFASIMLNQNYNNLFSEKIFFNFFQYFVN